MIDQLLGIHHVTAIAGDAQQNLDFYTKVLGLTLVKKTVNFDDPFTYHLYFGDEVGSPGTLLTFFPWSLSARRGRKGPDQIASYAFSVPQSSIQFWKNRLEEFHVPVSAVERRFGEDVLVGNDPDGFVFELVGISATPRHGRTGSVPGEFVIVGLHSVTLCERSAAPSMEYLTEVLGFRQTAREGERTRLSVGASAGVTYVDILERPDDARGSMGAGIIHHVAFRAADDEAQVRIRQELLRSGTEVTPVIDRTYFHSIYFHEPGGVLLEVATDGPGFLTDESKDELGTHLKLPPQHEPSRSDIEKHLPKLH